MRNKILSILLLLLLPAVLLTAGLSFPRLYQDSYYAELVPMTERLEQAEGKKLILIGGSCMLVELFGHITFGWPMFNWSLYCVSVFGLLGLFLFIATLIPPMRDYLRRTFFF